jgi:very-short-patch-repair endonuclease
MQHQSTSSAQSNARTLRREMTDSERKLWSGLRSKQLGVKFRRQHPLGNYIADFACLEPKLIIELDGSQHADQQVYDARRDELFRAQGFGVLRFPTNEPLRNLDGVLTAILDRLNGLSSAAPIPAFPQRGKVEIPRSNQ